MPKKVEYAAPSKIFNVAPYGKNAPMSQTVSRLSDILWPVRAGL